VAVLVVHKTGLTATTITARLGQKLPQIQAIGVKEGNRLLVGGEEVEL
jgi:hypothetical protein